MCRYFYGQGRCANSDVDSVICIGETDCESFSEASDQMKNDCDSGSWYGLYCAKYKRFFCPGKESCETYEEYAQSLQENRRTEERGL